MARDRSGAESFAI